MIIFIMIMTMMMVIIIIVALPLGVPPGGEHQYQSVYSTPELHHHHHHHHHHPNIIIITIKIFKGCPHGSGFCRRGGQMKELPVSQILHPWGRGGHYWGQ